jgi:hypothetical protein
LLEVAHLDIDIYEKSVFDICYDMADVNGGHSAG